MKRFILAIILTLAFCASDCFALNLRPYMQTPPEVQTFAKRVIEDGGKVVDLEYAQKLTRLVKQLDIWGNGKFLGDGNLGVKLNSGVSVQTLYDLSGNNNDATSGVTVNNQPVWTKNVQGGRAGLVFDGANTQRMDVSNESMFDFTDTFSIVVIYRSQKTVPIPYPTLLSKGLYQVSGWYLECGYSLGGNLEASTGSVHKTLVSEHTDSTFALSSFISNSGSANAYLNGAFKNSLESFTSLPNDLVLQIGYYSGGTSTNDFNGIVGSILLLDTALTTAQRTALETFIGHSYYAIY